MLSRNTTLLLVLSILIAGCAHPSASDVATASGSDGGQINFLSIVVDEDTAAADARLTRFLERAVSRSADGESAQRKVSFPQMTMPYGDVIRAFAERPEGTAYLARITPYAYVAAEMLGAKLKILAIYRSAATGKTTYNSYFVVRRDKFQEHTVWKPEMGAPTLEHVRSYVERLKPARFMYHDRFSTSSYFLPSLYFKARDIFAMSYSINPSLTPIRVERLASTSSSDLVEQVWSGNADLVAVWDGTKKKFDEPGDDAHRRQVGEEVLFIRNPTAVPNDFLVSSGTARTTDAAIVGALRTEPAAGRVCTDRNDPPALVHEAERNRRTCDMPEYGDIRPKDDFDAWYAWDTNDSQVSDATRLALARLRQDARHRPPPVVVDVRGNDRGLGPEARMLLNSYVDAAKEAVRLSGTEFVLVDADLHKRVDMTWTLESTHDGALKLTSALDPVFDQPPDSFSISFVNRSDLPQRIADLVRSRLRRIRYVWPYEEMYPAVLRDLDFTPDHQVLVQKISWIDPKRNDYQENHPFPARIDRNTDFSKFRLSDERQFPKNPDGSFNFDPLSNVAYRVVIARQPQAGWLWQALPLGFIALFGLACAGLLVDVRRRQPPPRGLQQTYQRMIEDYHRPWCKEEIEENEKLWSDSESIDEVIKELKTAGSFLDVVKAGGCDFDIGPFPVRFSILMKLGSGLFPRHGNLPSELIETGVAGVVPALNRLIHFLVGRRRLSAFIGFPDSTREGVRTPAWPIEWEALNDIASRHFQQLGISDKPVEGSFGAAAGALVPVVSNHFQGVIKRATKEPSLFIQNWTVSQQEALTGLVCEHEMRSPLVWRDENGLTQPSRVRLEVVLPPAAMQRRPFTDATLRAWVFGKVVDWTVEHGVLSLHIKPMAILKDYDHQH